VWSGGKGGDNIKVLPIAIIYIMKLDPDCVRHVMLTIEEKSTPYNILYYKDLFTPDFNNDDIKYATLKLAEAGYIETNVTNYNIIDFPLQIKGITWQGHQFLGNIGDDIIWNETKSETSTLKSVSIYMLSKIAYRILAAKFSDE
jgi:hypothetical protein